MSEEIVVSEDYIKQQVASYIAALQKLKDSGQIESFSVSDVKVKWQTWSRWQKFVWRVMTKYGIQKRALKKYRQRFNDIRQNSFKTGIEAVDELNDFESKHYKYWYTPSPMSDIELDVKFKPVPENVNTNVEVKNDKDRPVA